MIIALTIKQREIVIKSELIEWICLLVQEERKCLMLPTDGLTMKRMHCVLALFDLAWVFLGLIILGD